MSPAPCLRVAVHRARRVLSMTMQSDGPRVDIVMAGTFAAWRLGTLQARALPFARELQARGIRCAIVTVPWDKPDEAGVIDAISGVNIYNTATTGVLSFPFAVCQEVRQIVALKPGAVHVFKPKGYGGLAGWVLQGQRPILVDSDDWEGDGGWNQAGGYSRLQRRLFQWQEQSLLRSAHAVTAASHLLVHRARHLRCRSPKSVSWVPNGLESSWAHRLADGSQRTGSDRGDRPTIVLYSRFAEFPRDWLPRFLSDLSERLPDEMQVTVVTVGQDNLPSLEFPNVWFEQMGYVARDAVRVVLLRSHIAVYPYEDSLIARSKNSVKLLELMAAGCAVVASRTGDVPAVAADDALLLDRSEPQGFADAVVRLLRCPSEQARLSSAARARALTMFCVPSVVDRLEDAYRTAGVLGS